MQRAAETETGRLTRALAQAQAELMASRLEVSGTRAETVHFKGFLRRAEADIAAAQANSAVLEGEIASLKAQATEIAALRTSLGHVQAERDALRASFSWRISAPVRLVGGWLRRARPATRPNGAAPEPPPMPAPAAPPADPPADPNAPYIFRPMPVPSDPPSGTTPVVTLDELHQLSRSL
jgi:hypothetical protein